MGKASGGPETERTAEFVLMFDKLFDCLDVSRLDAGNLTRNGFKTQFEFSRHYLLILTFIGSQ